MSFLLPLQRSRLAEAINRSLSEKTPTQVTSKVGVDGGGGQCDGVDGGGQCEGVVRGGVW